MNKFIKILVECVPILVMIGLMPMIDNDYQLALIYTIIIVFLLMLKKQKNDLLFLCLGFCVMIVSEAIFVSTGVETFTRTTLFGLMPIWLPFLWAYGFVVMKRSVRIIEG